jgi:hypothetical protein
MTSSEVVMSSLGRGPIIAAEEARDQEADQRQKDDGVIHALSPSSC